MKTKKIIFWSIVALLAGGGIYYFGFYAPGENGSPTNTFIPGQLIYADAPIVNVYKSKSISTPSLAYNATQDKSVGNFVSIDGDWMQVMKDKVSYYINLKYDKVK